MTVKPFIIQIERNWKEHKFGKHRKVQNCSISYGITQKCQTPPEPVFTGHQPQLQKWTCLPVQRRDRQNLHLWPKDHLWTMWPDHLPPTGLTDKKLSTNVWPRSGKDLASCTDLVRGVLIISGLYYSMTYDRFSACGGTETGETYNETISTCTNKLCDLCVAMTKNRTRLLMFRLSKSSSLAWQQSKFPMISVTVKHYLTTDRNYPINHVCLSESSWWTPNENCRMIQPTLRGTLCLIWCVGREQFWWRSSNSSSQDGPLPLRKDLPWVLGMVA